MKDALRFINQINDQSFIKPFPRELVKTKLLLVASSSEFSAAKKLQNDYGVATKSILQ